MKRGLKLNLIKKFGERKGGGNPTTLTVSSLVSDKEAKSDKNNFGEGVGGGGGTETNTVCHTVSNEVNTKMQLSTHRRVCGTINISKYVNIFLSTKPYNFYMSSLVSEFCQRI